MSPRREKTPLEIAKQKLVPSEHTEQAWFFDLLTRQSDKYPGSDLGYATPNAAKRSKWERGQKLAEGLKANVPDFCIPVARGPFHGLYIEFKREGEKLRPGQEEFAARLRAEGYACFVAFTAHEGMAIVAGYYVLEPALKFMLSRINMSVIDEEENAEVILRARESFWRTIAAGAVARRDAGVAPSASYRKPADSGKPGG